MQYAILRDTVILRLRPAITAPPKGKEGGGSERVMDLDWTGRCATTNPCSSSPFFGDKPTRLVKPSFFFLHAFLRARSLNLMHLYVQPSPRTVTITVPATSSLPHPPLPPPTPSLVPPTREIYLPNAKSRTHRNENSASARARFPSLEPPMTQAIT
jgi:hypothetical protein